MNRAFIAIPALLALGCASVPNVQTNRDPLVPLPKGATWAWGTRDTVSQYEMDPSAQNPILHQRVKTAIERSLEKKGFKQVAAPSDAVLVVTYHIGMKRSTEMQTSTIATGMTYGGYGGWYGGYGWGYYGAPTYVTNTELVDYKQGGVLVYIRDRATGKVAWAGLITKDVHDTDQVTAETVQRGADDLFRDLK